MGFPCPPLPWHPTSTGHPSCRDTLHPPAPADPQASCAHQDLVRLLEGRHPLQQLPGDVLAGCPVGAGARARARDRDRGRGRGRQQQQQQRREAEAEVETVERGHGRSVPPPAPAPGSYGVAAGGESPGQVAPAPRYCEIAASLESRTDTGPGSPGCAPPRPAPRPAGTGRDGQENPGQFLAAPRPGPPRRQRHGPDRDPRARPGTPPPGAPGPPCRGHRAARAGRESPETGVVVVPSVSPRRPLRVPSVCVPRCVAQCPPSPLTPPPRGVPRRHREISRGGPGAAAGGSSGPRCPGGDSPGRAPRHPRDPHRSRQPRSPPGRAARGAAIAAAPTGRLRRFPLPPGGAAPGLPRARGRAPATGGEGGRPPRPSPPRPWRRVPRGFGMGTPGRGSRGGEGRGRGRWGSASRPGRGALPWGPRGTPRDKSGAGWTPGESVRHCGAFGDALGSRGVGRARDAA